MAGAWIRYCYANRRPLPVVWRRLSSAGRRCCLAYWLERAERDPWAFCQLCDLSAAILDAGRRLPVPLRRFTSEVLRGKRTIPARWRSNVIRDLRVAALVRLAVEQGVSRRSACRTIGEALNLSPEAVESSCRRGESV